MFFILLLSFCSVSQGLSACNHGALNGCLLSTNSAIDTCIKLSNCIDFIGRYEQKILSLPNAVLHTAPDISTIPMVHIPTTFVQHLKPLPSGVLVAASNVINFTPKDITDASYFMVSVLNTKGAQCRNDEYRGYTDNEDEVAVYDCIYSIDHSCQCTVKLASLITSSVQPTSLIIYFTPLISTGNVDVYSTTASVDLHRYLAADTSAEDIEAEIQPPNIPSDPNNVAPVVVVENRKAVKTVHSVFVLVAFAGNAAFLIFVFWFSRF
jgi:hypothetical protein